jgi:hypothetical protein
MLLDAAHSADKAGSSGETFLDCYASKLAQLACTLKGITCGIMPLYSAQRPHEVGKVQHAWECRGAAAYRVSIEAGQRMIKHSINLG